MSRAIPEWVGKTDDSAVPPRVKLRLFDKVCGFCQGPCGRWLGTGDKPFHADHIKALINGGENRESNLQILCDWCHADKTVADVAVKSATYKTRARHLGIRAARSSFQTNRNGQFKKRMDGTVVRR